ncbi:hypothetical protein PISL3812_07140 [Talaromyces islandicus]|uniref:tyrosinase n=1 Tax=Talaromyces islandicus TaxID=28573 RepID=A0A0U1M3F3_TALIS|nr:hypothetical protein PISL3812_07140 [Talaromyces islandicus]
MVSSQSYAIKGIPVAEGSIIPARREVDEWFHDPEAEIQVSLFVEALTRFQKIDYKDKLSYFRVAGIHSAPNVTWDEQEDPKPNPGGYCVHNDITFPTWHRPYMLLYEQRIYELMLEVIKEKVPTEHKKEWSDAASQWRLPHWDFAKGVKTGNEWKLGLPAICSSEPISIKDPMNPKSTKTVPNPAYKFVAPMKMGQLDAPFTIHEEPIDDKNTKFFPWNGCKATTKYGLKESSGNTDDAGQDIDKSNSALNEHHWYRDNWGTGHPSLQSLRYEVHRLFCTEFQSWGAFASTKYWNKDNPRDKDGKPINSSEVGDILSLEFLHNNNWIGGTDYLCKGDEKFWGAGHMSSIKVSAFDPIFWFYHCNVDRLTAIWQVLNSDKWFQEDDPLRTSPLKPFHQDTNFKYFTSEDVKKWRQWGYDYDIVKKPGTNEDRQVVYVREIINDLYGEPASQLFGEQYKHDYVVNVIYDRYALDGIPYTIVFYLNVGDKNAMPVGGVYNFSTKLHKGQEDGEDQSCSNCLKQEREGILSAAQIALTYTFALKPEISISPGIFRDWMKGGLSWKVIGLDTTVYYDSTTDKDKDSRWKSLKVIPAYGEIAYPEGRKWGLIPDKFPVYHEYEPIDLDVGSA